MKKQKKNYVVVATNDWNFELFKENSSRLPGNWFLIKEMQELTKERLDDISPRYLFFPHWSWIVPDDVISSFECVCFHMTDVPYGRGGSPLQNLLVRGHRHTKLTALRMVAELDAGPVYLKEPLSLQGKAHIIYRRAAVLSWKMIEKIITEEPQPKAQEGLPVQFHRRKPEQSELNESLRLEQLFDRIRMLDAPGYPKAFIETDHYRIEFNAAEIRENSVQATCEIFLKRKDL